MAREQERDDPVRVLLALPAGHPYRAVADGSYRPGAAADDTAWEIARSAAVRLLADNARSHAEEQHSSLTGKRGSVTRYLYWLAADDPDGFRADDPVWVLDLWRIGRYLATETVQRRSTHRSRVAVRSQIRSFAAGYPHLFYAPPPVPGDDPPPVPPMDDWQFDLAYRLCEGFRNPGTRNRARLLLLLGRAAGLNGGDMQWVEGHHVQRRRSAGLFVVVPPEAKRPGEVPVLTRHADRLADLAYGRPGLLVADTTPPCDPSSVRSLCIGLNRKVAQAGERFTVSPEALRRAWFVEHVAANVPVNTLLKAARVTSFRTFEELLADHGPQAPERDSHYAYELGGVVPKRERGGQ